MKHLEVKSIEVNGITVYVKIDYDNGLVSLVERYPHGSEWTIKPWIFADRGLEYMASWQNILNAMQEAVKMAKLELEKDLAEKTKFKEDFVEGLIKRGLKPAKKKK